MSKKTFQTIEGRNDVVSPQSFSESSKATFIWTTDPTGERPQLDLVVDYKSYERPSEVLRIHFKHVQGFTFINGFQTCYGLGFPEIEIANESHLSEIDLRSVMVDDLKYYIWEIEENDATMDFFCKEFFGEIITTS